MKTKIALSIFIIVVIVGGLAGIKAMQIRALMAAGKAYVQPPETVSAAVAREEKWQDTITAIGSIDAVQGVTITPDIPGTVKEIAFESGAVVAKGDLLVKLDVSSEEAQLRALEAQVDWAKLTLERQQTLRKENMLSQADLDSADVALRQAVANADAVRATIEKKTIRAPFAGKLGIRLVNLGQYLDTGKPIASLQSLNPVYANFSLPQQELAKLKNGMRVHITTDAYPGREFEGKLTAINPDLDATTRSVGLQATLDNADQALRAGMYARVEVMLPQEESVLVVPATSVLSLPFGDSVFVIEPKSGGSDDKPQFAVRQQLVRTVKTRGDFVVIVSGIKPGDRVVNSGLFKLRSGMSVVENNDLAPRNEKTPHPPEA